MQGHKLSDYNCNQGNSAINIDITTVLSSQVYNHSIPILNKERELTGNSLKSVIINKDRNELSDKRLMTTNNIDTHVEHCVSTFSPILCLLPP